MSKPETTHTDAVYDFTDIARRMKGVRPPEQDAPTERKPFCTAIHQGCDWPDCPCGQP